VSRFGGLTVYHDSLSGNQDPYVWNRRFLHTTCHMSQMSPQVGDIEFWVSGDTFPAFIQLCCDLVFVVEDKVVWQEANRISAVDPMVESPAAYADHYRWIPDQHPYKRRRRFTLKAESDRSFQPQTIDHTLIDVVPVLEDAGLSLPELRTGLRAGFRSKPFRLTPDVTRSLYEFLAAAAEIRLAGSELEPLRLSDRWPPEPLPRGGNASARYPVHFGPTPRHRQRREHCAPWRSRVRCG
jgi:hypothetical protein